MQEHQRRKLKRILVDLKRLSNELEEILTDEPVPPIHEKKELRTNIDAQKILDEISTLDRQVAIKRLQELKHQELGEVFLVAGGLSTDKKKPKEWLVEQIIWRVFDFKRGHEVIRNLGQS